MKKLLFFISFCVGLTVVKAQSPVIQVRYTFLHVDDTTQRERPRQEEMHLYATPQWSVYLRESEIGSAQYFFKQGGGDMKDFNILNSIEESGHYIQHFGDKQSFFTERILNQFYRIKEPLAQIDWEITSETKEIGGFSTKKATATFRGRKYEAWFCEDIPLQAGPWKLQGLPGLILEAKDTSGEVQFNWIGLQETKLNPKTFAIPEKANMHHINQERYQKIYEGFIANPGAFARAVFGDNVVAGGASGGGSSNAKKYNNPIERP